MKITAKAPQPGDEQWPQASASSKHVAWLHMVPLGTGVPRMDLVVDQVKMAENVDDFEWLGDASVVLTRGDGAPEVLRIE